MASYNRYSAEIEQRLGCKQLLDSLEKRFAYFLGQKNRRQGSGPKLLRQIKFFLHEDKAFREALCAKSRLSGSDCLTLTAIGVLLARRNGLKAEIGVPRKVSRALHAVLLYPEASQQKVFIIAGRTMYQNPRAMQPSEIIIRLVLIKPIVNMANVIRNNPIALRGIRRPRRK